MSTRGSSESSGSGSGVKPAGEETVGVMTGVTGVTGVTGTNAVSDEIIETGDSAVQTQITDAGVQDTPAQETAPTFEWHKDASVAPQTRALARRLESCNLYRTPDGKIAQLIKDRGPRLIRDAVDLEAVIRENIEVAVYKKGSLTGYAIPSADLKVLLRSSELQASLPVVDKILTAVTYTEANKLTMPGYNPGPEGERYFMTGKEVVPVCEPAHIRQFLEVMPFNSPADASNAVGLALTILLRQRFPGGKPMGQITANKSHSGKDTVLDFAKGNTRHVEISHHYRDWALQNEAVSALADLDVGVLVVGNIRTGGAPIESAFLERLITSRSGRLQSSKRSGDGYERGSDFVVVGTANQGKFSTDLANRGLPIHLEQVGDIKDRKSSIGDPRWQFLVEHRDEIEAELCGLIENWKDQGCPLDESVRHPMKSWAQTIGGILKANGFQDFLANWDLQMNVNDATREALGWLAEAAIAGAASAEPRWHRVDALRKMAEDQGVLGDLMEPRHQQSTTAATRQLGKVLTAHRDESLVVETDDGVRRYAIRKDRNTKTGQLATVYWFEPLSETETI